MQTVFENIIEKLEEKHEQYINQYGVVGGNPMAFAVKECKEIVKQEAAEYNNGWIPVEERMPEEAFGCLVTVIDCNPVTLTEFENILPYVVGYDGDSWNDADGEEIPFEVIAWRKLPTPYQPKGE